MWRKALGALDDAALSALCAPVVACAWWQKRWQLPLFALRAWTWRKRRRNAPYTIPDDRPLSAQERAAWDVIEERTSR